MQGESNMSTQARSEAFLSRLVGKFIVVHTLASGDGTPASYRGSQAATLYGRLESNFPDALVLEVVEDGQPNGGTILVYKRAIVAIEARRTMTQ